jgi:phasin family protein
MVHCNKCCLYITITNDEENIMANDTIKLFKDIAEKSVASFKNVGELNLRTFEALAAKQVEIVQNAADAGVKQSAIFTDSKDVNDLLSAQSDLANSYTETLTKSVTEISDILKGAQDELVSFTEVNIAEAKSNTEKVAAEVKANAEKVVAKVKANTEKVVADAKAYA